MRRFFQKLQSIPLDIKVFIISSLMIIGILFLPDTPQNGIPGTAYISFCFISIAISSFYMTYVADSKYNFFINSSSKKDVIKTVLLYGVIVVMVSYV